MCKKDWTVVGLFCVLTIALLTVVWYSTKLKLENTKLNFTNELLQQSLERQYVPDGYRNYDN